jgi:hypothetical protein
MFLRRSRAREATNEPPFDLVALLEPYAVAGHELESIGTSSTDVRELPVG